MFVFFMWYFSILYIVCLHHCMYVCYMFIKYQSSSSSNTWVKNMYQLTSRHHVYAIDHCAAGKSGRLVLSTGDDRRPLLTATGHVHRRCRCCQHIPPTVGCWSIRAQCVASTVVYRRRCGQQSSIVDRLCWKHLTTIAVPWRSFPSPGLRGQKWVTRALPSLFRGSFATGPPRRVTINFRTKFEVHRLCHATSPHM